MPVPEDFHLLYSVLQAAICRMDKKSALILIWLGRKMRLKRTC